MSFMKNSKFNKIYTENINNIITEKYHHKFLGGWNQKTAGEAIAKMLKSAVRKDIESLNDLFVPKSWFDFKKVFKEEPELNIINYNVTGCKIQVRLSAKLVENDILNLLYGKKKGEGIGHKKPGGLIFNKEFTDILEKIGYSIDDSSKASDGDGLKFDILFSFYKPKFVENAKQSKRINPNYLKSIVGNIYLVFDDNEDLSINVGTCEYFQSRYANMDPPKPLKDQIKDMWDKPNKDFGLLGSLVSKGIGAATTGLTGGLFSKTVQEENFEITINEKFNFSNNVLGGDIDNKSNEALDEAILDEMEEWINNMRETLGDTRISFDIDNVDNRNYNIIIRIDDISLVNINIGIK